MDDNNARTVKKTECTNSTISTGRFAYQSYRQV